MIHLDNRDSRAENNLERFPESSFRWKLKLLPLVVLLIVFVLVLMAQPSRRGGGGCSGGGGASYLGDHGSDACAQNEVWIGNGAP